MDASSLSNAAPAPFSFHCTICFEAFHAEKRYPVVLPCGHTFLCHQCSKRLKRCMECRTSLYYTPPQQPHQPPTASAGGAPGPAAGRGGDLRGSRTSSFTRRGGQQGGRGGTTAQQQQEKRKPAPAAEPIPLPLPKNLILLSLMETAHEEARATRPTEIRPNGSRSSSRAATPTSHAPRSPHQLRSKSSSATSTLGGEDGEQLDGGGSAAEAPSPSGSMCLSADGEGEDGSRGEQGGVDDGEEPLDYDGCETDDDDDDYDDGDEWCEDGGEDDLVRHGIQIFGGMCGTYAVADPDGLTIYPTMDLEEEGGGSEKDDEGTAAADEAAGEGGIQRSGINVDANDERGTSPSQTKVDADRAEGKGSVSGDSKGASVSNEVRPEVAQDTSRGEDGGINRESSAKTYCDGVTDCSSSPDSTVASPLVAQGMIANNEQVDETKAPVGGESHTSTTVIGSEGEHRQTAEKTDDEVVKVSACAAGCSGDPPDGVALGPKFGDGKDNASPCQRLGTEVIPEKDGGAAAKEEEVHGAGGDGDASEKTVECLTNPQDASPTARAVVGDKHREAIAVADDGKQSMSQASVTEANSADQATEGDKLPSAVDHKSPGGDRGGDKENWRDFHHLRRPKRGGLVCGYLRNPVIIVETKTSDSFMSLDEQASNDVSSVRGETSSHQQNSPAHAAAGGVTEESPPAQEIDVSVAHPSAKASNKENMADQFLPLGDTARSGVLKPRSYRGEWSNNQEEEAEIVASIWGDMQKRRSSAEAKDMARIWGIFNLRHQGQDGGGSEGEQLRNKSPMFSTIQGGASNYVNYGDKEVDARDRSMLDDDDDEEGVVQVGVNDECQEEGGHDESWNDPDDQSQPKEEASSRQNWVPYGSKVQVAHIDQGSGWVTLARNRGYLRIVPGSSQLVKVGVPLDKACQIQGIIYLLNERKNELDKNRDELDRIAAKLDKDLQKALDTSGEVAVIERRKQLETLSPKRPTSPGCKFEDQSFRQGVAPRTPSPSQINSRLSTSLGQMHPGAPPPPPPLSPEIVGSRSFETALKGPNSDGRTPPNTARRVGGPHPPLPGEATPPGKKLDFRTGMSGHMALSSASAHIPHEVHRGMVRFMGHHHGIAPARKSRKSSPLANRTASQDQDVEGPRGAMLNCSQPLRSVNDTTVALSNEALRNYKHTQSLPL